MKRIFGSAVAALALACALPATALAHHHARHAHSKRHAHRARVLQFGSVRAASTTPSTPTPQTPSGSSAGTVKSFENGVLVITLNDGKSTEVSGKFTSESELICQSATTSGGGDDQGEDDDESGSSNGDRGSSAVGQFVRQNGDSFSAPGQGEGQDQDDEQTQGTCTPTTALVTGAMVLGAELKLGEGGSAVWEKVVVQH